MTDSEDTLVLDMVALRNYIGGSVRTAGEDILADAFVRQDPGAMQLIRFTCSLRRNRRTRRSLADVQREYSRPVSQRARWLRTLETAVFAQWRVLRQQCAPQHVSAASSSRIGHLSRRT